jgi:hypothetical protein
VRAKEEMLAPIKSRDVERQVLGGYKNAKHIIVDGVIDPLPAMLSDSMLAPTINPSQSAQ